MDEYPLIANHGLVGDLQTAALVSSEGTVDWWCSPRFDSPSLFAALLDRHRGGHCRLAVASDVRGQATVRQLYLPDTAILFTRFMAPSGVGEVADYMLPDESGTPTDRHRLVRVARVMRGCLPFEFECRPRFDYGRARHDLTAGDRRTAVMHGPGTDLAVQATEPVELHPDGADVHARFTLDAGQMAVITLTAYSSGAEVPRPPNLPESREDFGATREFWLDWLRTSTYRGRWPQMVNRSAITLKLLTYAPTGAPIAAATMGLPEEVGGERNWDYRYTWVRDASLSVRTLVELGFTREAGAFRRWMRERLDAGDTASGE